MFNLIKRYQCVLCHSTNLVLVGKTPPIPCFQGTSDNQNELGVKFPISAGVCEDCSTIQLLNILPQDVIYADAHASGLGAIWDDHNKTLAKLVFKYGSGNIVEIGGGNAKLASEYFSSNKSNRWEILDPNPMVRVNINSNINFVKGYFDDNFSLPGDTSIVVMSHVLEHMYDLYDSVKLLAEKIPLGKTLILSWPDIESWMDDVLPGAINWEHTYCCSIHNLKVLFSQFGFKLINESNFNKHSIFMVFERNKPDKYAKFESKLAESKSRVMEYFQGFIRKARKAREMIKNLDNVYLCPASVYSQYLLAYGLDSKKINGILDNSPYKQGKYLFGSNLLVLSPSHELSEELKPTVLLNAGAHNDEVSKGLKMLCPSINIIKIDLL